jgi:hypothetical protein
MGCSGLCVLRLCGAPVLQGFSELTLIMTGKNDRAAVSRSWASNALTRCQLFVDEGGHLGLAHGANFGGG